jgi:hypothetical protein
VTSSFSITILIERVILPLHGSVTGIPALRRFIQPKPSLTDADCIFVALNVFMAAPLSPTLFNADKTLAYDDGKER